MGLMVQTIIDFWPFFATVALAFLLIFHQGGVCRRLERELGLQRARLNEMMLMFQDLQRGRSAYSRAPKEVETEAAETKSAPATGQEETPVTEEAPSVAEKAAAGSSEPAAEGQQFAGPAEEVTEAPTDAPWEPSTEETEDDRESVEQLPLGAAPKENFQEFPPQESAPEETPEIPPPGSEDFSTEAAYQESPPADTPATPPRPRADRPTVTCNGCGNKLAYTMNLSGKKARCPACKTIVMLP